MRFPPVSERAVVLAMLRRVASASTIGAVVATAASATASADASIEAPVAHVQLCHARCLLTRHQAEVDRLEKLAALEAAGEAPADSSASPQHAALAAPPVDELEALRAQLREEVRRREAAEEEAQRLRRAVPARTQQLLGVQPLAGAVAAKAKPLLVQRIGVAQRAAAAAASRPVKLTAANLQKVATQQALQQQSAVKKPRRMITERPTGVGKAGMGKAALARRAASWSESLPVPSPLPSSSESTAPAAQPLM